MTREDADNSVVVADASELSTRGCVIHCLYGRLNWGGSGDAQGVYFDDLEALRSLPAPNERQLRWLTRAPWYHPLAHQDERLMSYYIVGGVLAGRATLWVR